MFSNLEKELAALDETPVQSPPQQEQPEETAATAEPEESQNGNAAQPQKVIYGLCVLPFTSTTFMIVCRHDSS